MATVYVHLTTTLGTAGQNMSEADQHAASLQFVNGIPVVVGASPSGGSLILATDYDAPGLPANPIAWTADYQGTIYTFTTTVSVVLDYLPVGAVLGPSGNQSFDVWTGDPLIYSAPTHYTYYSDNWIELTLPAFILYPVLNSVIEGNTGAAASLTFLVEQTGSASGTRTVSYSVTGSQQNPANAADFADGVLPSGIITFLPGERHKMLTLSVQGDTASEADEQFLVTLFDPSPGLTIDVATAAGTIIDDDEFVMSIAELLANGVEGNIGTTPFTFTVTLNRAATRALSVDWSITGSGVAAADASDFLGAPQSGTVLFSAGEVNKTITVYVSGDQLPEEDETFAVMLTNPSDGATLGINTAIGTIMNDDAGLFTTGADEVDFNALRADQKAAIQAGADLYHGLGGNDKVTLPDIGSGKSLDWDYSSAFDTGEKTGQTYTIVGGDGTDNIILGDGNDRFFGSPGSDMVTFGAGRTIFDFQDISLAAFDDATQRLIGRAIETFRQGAANQNLLLLAGSSSQYSIDVEFESQTWSGTKTTVSHIDTGGQPTVTFLTSGIERIQFETQIDNQVRWQPGELAIEMLQLNSDVYGSLSTTPLHRREDLAYQGGTHSGTSAGVAAAAEAEGWHAVSALELGIGPADYGQWGTLRYSFVNGSYQAYDIGRSLGGDPSEANAVILTGVLNGYRTLAVVFRGSDQVADFDDYPNFKDHYDKYRPLTESLDEFIRDSNIQQILVGGHSLGGGVAQYFAQEFSGSVAHFSGYTDGSPGAEVGSLQDPFLNFVHVGDPVGAWAPYASTPAGKALALILGALASKILPAAALAELATEATSALIRSGISISEAASLVGRLVASAPKQHAGSTVFIRIDGDVGLAQHDRDLYTSNVARLSDIADDPNGPFYKSELGGALRNDLLYSGGDVLVNLGTSGDDRLNYSDGELAVASPHSTYLLAGAGNDVFDVGNVFDTVVGLLTSGNGAHVIDGGAGLDTITIPIFISSAELIRTAKADGGIHLTWSSPEGAVSLADVYRVERLILSDDVLRLDGDALVVQRPDPGSGQSTAPSFFQLMSGIDYAETGDGSFTVQGTSESDVVYVGLGTVFVATGAGDDTLIVKSGPGAAMPKTLDGGLGADLMVGGAEDDTYIVESSGDVVVDTVGGVDTVKSSVDFALPDGVEILVLTGTALVGVGNASDNRIVGNDNANTLFGAAGNDTLEGLGASDILVGGPGADRLDGGAGIDYGSYIDASAAVTASLANPSANTDDAAGDTYVGIEGLIGSPNDDVLTGDSGNNWLAGGLGADKLNGGAAIDFASYFQASSAVVVSLAKAASNTGEAAGDSYTSIEGLVGSPFDDVLTGDSANNLLEGGPGADRLDGGAGLDLASYFNAVTGVTASLGNPAGNTGDAAGDSYASIEGLAGSTHDDVLVGDAKDNTLMGNAGSDILDGGGGFDVASYAAATAGVKVSLAAPESNTGEAAGDIYTSIKGLVGSAFADTLTGDDSDNTLQGGPGGDQLNGAGGFDFASYATATSAVTASLANPTINKGEAAGDTYASIEGLIGSNASDALIGDAKDNTLIGNRGQDGFVGGAGDDTFYGGGTAAGSGLDGIADVVDYSTVSGLTQGIDVTWATGTVVGQVGIIDTDHLFQIEVVLGTAFEDRFDATGYTAQSTAWGDFNGYQYIVGGGGNDTIIGNFNTEVSYQDATSAIVAQMSVFGTGTVSGGGVGTDSLVGVNRLIGSRFDDIFWGTTSGDIFDGYVGGDDVFHGGAGTDTVEYDGSTVGRNAIFVHLADGIVTGGAGDTTIGKDTLDSIEQIRGSEFADTYDATGYSATSANAGSSGTYNQFEGYGGADTVIGNGNTRLVYFNASAGVTVSMSGGAGSATATYTNVATDTFTGVNRVSGSNFSDVIIGGAGKDWFEGRDGNDTLEGGADDDTLDGGAGADILRGGLGIDSLIGGADNDIFRGTLAELNGDLIVDYQEGDRIELLDVPAGATISVKKGSTIIDVDVDGDGVSETTFTLSTDLDVMLGSGLQFIVAQDDGVTILEFRRSAVSIQATTPGVIEGDAGAATHTFVVSLDIASIALETLAWSVSGTAAVPGDLADFGGVLPSGTLTFLPGEMTKTITVDVVGDLIVEFDEAFLVTLSNPSAGLKVDVAAASGTIFNDDAPIASIVEPLIAQAEGNSGATAFTFTVILDQASTVQQSIYWLVAGTGDHPVTASDFAGGVLPSGTLTFTAGETSSTITVFAAGDSIVEFDEFFTVTLANPSAGLTLGTASAMGDIQNEDRALISVVSISAAKPEGNADTTAFTFTVNLDQPSVFGNQTADWSVTGTGGNAADAADFDGTLPSGTVSFAASETGQVVTVLVTGDTAPEFNEDFTVTLSNLTFGLQFGTASASGTIQNDDVNVVSIAPLSASKAEGNSGTTAFTFTVSLDQAAVASQSVDWAVTGSGANPAGASDFGVSLPTGSLTFAAGEISTTVTVPVSGDTAVEPDEGFTVTLSNASAGLVIGTATASGTILNDEVAVAVAAHDDAYVIQRGQSLTLATSVLSNDEGATSASLLAAPTHGALQLTANGTFGYTPAVGFFGVDSFTYRAANGGTADDGQALVYVVPVQVGGSTTLDLLALTAEEQIAATYVAFFSRAADAAGFDFWVNQFVTGLPVQGPAALFANIASSFGISNEAKALYPFLANPFGASDGQIAAFLNSVYDNLFNRGSDAAGLAYWTGQVRQTLDSGQFVGSVLVNIMSGAQDSAVSKDITTLMGKVAVSLEFVHEQQEHNTIWAGAGDIAAATTLLEPVTFDPLSVLIGVRNAEALIAAHG